MNQVIQLSTVPAYSLVHKNFGKTDYMDVYQISKQTNESVDNITTKIFTLPKWVNILMSIRDFVAGLVGLRKGKVKETGNVEYALGSKHAFFTVSDRNDHEIVMAENDKHLNFRVSVCVYQNDSNTDIYLSTLVKFNNFWGKLYFLPVKPFHKLIIKSLLKNL